MASIDIGLKIAPNRAAAEYIRGKAALHPAAFGRLPEEVRMRAFTVARVQDFDALREIREELARLPEGGDWREIRKGVAARISPWMEEGKAGEAAARAKAELLLRTHGFQAYAAGRWRQQTAVKEALPYWQYLTAGDAHVRAEHAALDRMILPADDPFWAAHYPPWDWGCRCVVVALPRAAVEEDGAAVSTGEDAEAAAGAAAGGREPSGYAWRPGDLHLDLDGLRERYGEEGFREFAAAMHADRVEAGGRRVTAWEWLYEDIRRKDMAELRGLRHERLIARDWADASPAGREEGEPRKVSAARLIREAREAGRELALMHNHPDGEWAASAGDIATALANRDRVREVAACTAYGRSVLRVEPGPPMSRERAGAIRERLAKDRRRTLEWLAKTGLAAYDDGLD